MSKRQNVVSFGKGWVVIIFCMAAYFFYGGMNTDGLNVTIPLIAENIGVDQGVLFTYQSYACVLGVIIHILLSMAGTGRRIRHLEGLCLFAWCNILRTLCLVFLQQKITTI